MSNEKKRALASRGTDAIKDKTPRKRQKVTQRDVEPSTPPPPLPVTVPDTASFLRQINTLSHPASKYSATISDQFQKLRQPWNPNSDANRTKPGHLTTADYEDGYISEEGDKLLKAIHARKDVELQRVDGLKKGKKSRANKPIKQGGLTSAQYHGVKVGFRVDFTGILEKPPAKKGEQEKKQAEDVEEEGGDAKAKTKAPAKRKVSQWIPHARIFVGDKDLSTVKLARLARDIDAHDNDTFKEHFLSGVKGQESPTPDKTAAYAIGIESRAVGRASDVFGDHFHPSLDGYVLSKPQSAHEASNLFHNPLHGTGALGSQNSGQTATPDFYAFNEIVSETRKEHATKDGTTLLDVPHIRKAKAINVFAPQGNDIVKINTGRK